MAKTKPFGMIYSTGTPSHPAFFIRWQEGTTRKKKSGFKTKKEAAAALAEIRTHLGDGTLVERRKASVGFDTVAREWLRLRSEPDLGAHKDNVQRYEDHIEPFFKNTPLRAITSKQVLEFKLKLQEKLVCRQYSQKTTEPHPMAAKTVNLVLALLRIILNYAVQLEYLPISPVTRIQRGKFLIKISKKKLAPPIAEATDVARLLCAIKDIDFENGDVGEYPFFATLIYAGVRRGEALGLYWEDIDFARETIAVRHSYGGPPKSNNERIVPLPRELIPLLKEHRRTNPFQGKLVRCDRSDHEPHATGIVFTNPNTGGRYTENCKLEETLDAALVRIGHRHIRVHDLRHVFATFYLRAGGTLAGCQFIMGHQSSQLTYDTYAHFENGYLGDEVNRMSFANLAEATRSRPDAQIILFGSAPSKEEKNQ